MSLTKRLLAMLLALTMILGVLPMAALATEDETEMSPSEPTEASTESVALIDEDLAEQSLEVVNGFPSHMTLLQDKETTLAPGITERKVVVYDVNGDRVEMLIATADVSLDTVNLYANYKDNQNAVLGMQKTTEQAAAAEAKHEEPYSVVVAINASYYNTSNGRPTGAFVMEGIDATASGQGDAYPFFAMLKDGTYMIGAKGEYSTYKDQIQEAIGGYIHLVKDGEVCSGLNKIDKYPRQTVGITADGRVILMTSDGNQAPRSIGLTVQEQAEVMLALGCVEALHLDGGGSATYCSKPAGSDKLQVVNSPSNGSERAVSNTLMIVSTAAPDGTFANAILTAEYDYVTPSIQVKVSAIGVDASGNAAEIPENITWQLADSTMGTVENGVFTSNGTVGEAVIQMVYDGKVVGETSVNVVVPDSLTFGRENLIVPNGETVDLPLQAFCGVQEVVFAASDVELVLETAEAGTLNGLAFTAPGADSGITSNRITATLKANTAVSAATNLTFGKGSEVIFSFEEGTDGADMGNWIVRTHESDIANNEHGNVYIVNKETGLVHDGEQALAFHTDFSQTTGSGSSTAGYIALSMSWDGEPISIKGAQTLGFWIYIPEDAVTTEVTLNAVYYDANGVAQRRTVDAMDDNGAPIYTPYWKTNMEESGWHYVKVDLSKFSDDLYIKDEPTLSGAYKRNFFIKIYTVFGEDTIDFADFHGDFTYYIDNITVDYSDAVEDRELPVFGEAKAYGITSETALGYGKVTELKENSLVFGVNVADNTNKTNYSGLNASTAKVFVDGNLVGSSYANGVISSDDITLADGYHTVRFQIADNNGNVKTIVRNVNVTTGSELPTVELIPHDATLDRLLSGSVYWVDLVSDDIADIKQINAILDLNSVNEWELDHMVVADGFDVSWTATAAQTAENDVVLTVVRNGEEIDGSSNVIASIPVRVWESRVHEYAGHASKTPAYMWTAGRIDPREVRVEVDQGLVTFVDNSTSFFSDSICVDTEAYTHYFNMDKTYHTEKGSYHVHTETALEDKPATCTETGYTGRTYCEVCDSVVNWGTTVPATGHTYEEIDGVLQCVCGELFTGVHTDGKIYVDGVCVDNTWVEDSYYVGGEKLTGVQKVPAPGTTDEYYYYDFGEDGVCANQLKYTGLFFDEVDGVYRYSKLGVLTSGWHAIDDEWYYFRASTLAAPEEGYIYSAKFPYEFDETGRVVSGIWRTTDKGTSYYYAATYYYTDGWKEIDGKSYFFDDGYRYEGYRFIKSWGSNNPQWYDFGEDGALVGELTMTGLLEVDGSWYYLENGISQYGLYLIDGDYYYFSTSNNLKAVTGKYYLTNTNGLLDPGYYTFGEDGKMLRKNGIVAEDGGLYYYVNDVRTYAGLINIDGDLYYANSSGKIATGRYWVTKHNDILPSAYYVFGEDGKIDKQYWKNGIVEENGVLYYYVDNVRTYAGLFELDGDFYYANSSGKIATGRYWVTKGNGYLDAGYYEFGTDGKLLSGQYKNGIVEENGVLYYYVDNVRTYAGLFELDGELYYANSSGKIATGRYWVTKGNGYLDAGYYEFGTDGKLLPGQYKNGIVEEDGALYYYVNNVRTYEGLFELDGELYYANSSGKIATGRYWVTKNNGILPSAYYQFDETGKMI